MQIKKNSDIQIEFILTEVDLEEYDIKISELTHGSEKAHMLFQEMMYRAYTEHDFDAENTRLMVEVRIEIKRVIVVVTKIAEAFENHKMGGNWHPNWDIPDFMQAMLMGKDDFDPPEQEVRNNAVFSFNDLDEIANAAKRIRFVTCESRLYRYTSRYFLIIQDDDPSSIATTETILGEYGERYGSKELSEAYLIEYGELIIPKLAIEKLATYL
ncbi:MAG: adaptor protein MecA [Turicibacter sp.]|nr:adaptor protein MecA [Turicibacter sp.]